MLLAPLPAWLVAHDALLHGEDATTAFVTVLVLLVAANLFCRAMAKWLVPRLGFSGRMHAPPKPEAKAVPQPVRVAVSRHGGPNLRQVVRQLPPEVRGMLC